MWRFARSGLAGAAALAGCLAAGGPAAAGCVGTGFSFGPGVVSTATTIEVAADTDCVGELTPPWGVVVEGVDCVQRPKHGRVGLASPTQGAYKPAASFVGLDRFTIRIRFRAGDSRGATLVRYTVNVVRR